MKAYSSFDHLVASIVPRDGKDWVFNMTVIDPYTVYFDDSGTDKQARIVVAAYCTSTVSKWQKFETSWKAVAKEAGFEQFHMTEFAGCRPEEWCRDCRNGKTTAKNHPWREWSQTKRKEVLLKLARTICKYVDHGSGIAFTKEDIEQYVIQSPLRRTHMNSVGDLPFTFAAQTCGGELAKWRAINKKTDSPQKFVFDLTPQHQKDEIARVFLGAGHKPRFIDGLEQWFDVDINGVSYESRKNTVQLLSADMLAWVTAKIRAAQLFGKGWGKETRLIAFRFVDTKHLRIGFNTSQQMLEWRDKELAYLTAQNVEAANEENETGESGGRIPEIQSDDDSTNPGSALSDKSRTRSGESKEKAEG
jgi:hypothetical protein